MLEAEERQQAAFDKKLAQEEAWIRQGVRAQRSRAQGRIEALHAMRAERRARRERTGNVNLRLAEAERSGVKVIEAENMSFRLARRPAARARLHHDHHRAATRSASSGPTGRARRRSSSSSSASSRPQAGTITHGTKLEVVYFDQLRAQIDDAKTVADNIANGNETVTIDGRTRHVISYLQDFLFTPDRARTPAGCSPAASATACCWRGSSRSRPTSW